MATILTTSSSVEVPKASIGTPMTKYSKISKLVRRETVSAERLNGEFRTAFDDQVGHDFADDGAQLKPVGGKAESVKDTRRRWAGSDDRNLIGHHSFNTWPTTHHRHGFHNGKYVRDGLGADHQFLEIDNGSFGGHVQAAAVAAADDHTAVGHLLKREFTAGQADHRV